MITQSRLKEVLSYDPLTGNFLWKVAPGRRSDLVGAEAGCEDDAGYLVIKIDQQQYKAHRLAWLYVHGVLPVVELDHHDTNKKNNAIINLRPATHGENEANQPLRKTSTSGLKGVSWNKQQKKWRAYIGKDQKQHHLGFFQSKETAKRARDTAALNLHGNFARAS